MIVTGMVLSVEDFPRYGLLLYGVLHTCRKRHQATHSHLRSSTEVLPGTASLSLTALHAHMHCRCQRTIFPTFRIADHLHICMVSGRAQVSDHPSRIMSEWPTSRRCVRDEKLVASKSRRRPFRMIRIQMALQPDTPRRSELLWVEHVALCRNAAYPATIVLRSNSEIVVAP